MMKQYSQERGSVAAIPENLTSNLKSYIQDLKKVASTNKQKRSQHNSNTYFKQANFPNTTKNSNSQNGVNMQMVFINSPMGNSQNNINNALNNSKLAIQNDQEIMMLNQTQILSPSVTGAPQSRGGRISSNSTNATPSNKRQSNGSNPGNGGKSNILSNKALAYLNSKKANSILKNYEEAMNNPKFLNMSQSKNVMKRTDNNSSNANFNERGRSAHRSRGGARNQQEMVLSNDDQNFQLYSNMISPSNSNINNQIVTPQNKNTYNNLKQILDNSFNQPSQTPMNTSFQRPQKEVIIRKQSSKSLLRPETPTGKKQQQHNNNQPLSSKPSQQRVLSQVTSQRQDFIHTDSTAADIITNETTNSYANAHHRKFGSHNFVSKVQQQRSDAVDASNHGLATDEQRALLKKIHTLGNSIGQYKKQSLNISQKFGDSSINNELSLAKTGKMNNLNLSSLLKSNLLDEDGIEDLHFYFVSFNQHKHGILKMHENILKLSDAKAAKHRKSGVGIQVRNNGNQIAIRDDMAQQQEKTIESIEEEDLV